MFVRGVWVQGLSPWRGSGGAQPPASSFVKQHQMEGPRRPLPSSKNAAQKHRFRAAIVSLRLFDHQVQQPTGHIDALDDLPVPDKGPDGVGLRQFLLGGFFGEGDGHHQLALYLAV